MKHKILSLLLLILILALIFDDKDFIRATDGEEPVFARIKGYEDNGSEGAV